MRRLLPLVLLVLIPAPSAIADGCPATTCGTTSAVVPGSRTLLVRPIGQDGPAEAHDLVTAKRTFLLPRGLLSADRTTFVSSARTAKAVTTLSRYDARTGLLRSRWSLPGRWTASGVSADGRWIALTEYTQRPSMRVALVDRVRLVSRFALSGQYQLEALSRDAHRVFLIHWRRYGYDLQQYDVAARTLGPTRLAEVGEKMRGTALGAVASPHGDWQLTLYLKDDGSTFIHALDLRTGLAHCIDLPLIGDYASVGSTSLTLSPDERTLYLASPLLGRVTTVDLARLRVARVARFRPVSLFDYPFGIGPNAAVTADGRLLAFSGKRTMWLYDTASGVVHSPIRTGDMIAGLGFRPDGRRLVAIPMVGSDSVFDSATGRQVR